MDPEDEERIKSKISDVLLDDTWCHILSRYTNKIELESITYHLSGTTIYCRITISIRRDKASSIDDVKLQISYPGKLKELEKYLSEEFSYYKTKVIINFIPSADNKESIIFYPPQLAYDKRIITLNKEEDNDLSNLCYFLNSVEGIDFSYWTLLISKYAGETSNFECKTTIPLIQKFQKIEIKNFDIDEIDVHGILSEKEVKQNFINEILVYYNYKGPKILQEF